MGGCEARRLRKIRKYGRRGGGEVTITSPFSGGWNQNSPASAAAEPYGKAPADFRTISLLTPRWTPILKRCRAFVRVYPRAYTNTFRPCRTHYFSVPTCCQDKSTHVYGSYYLRSCHSRTGPQEMGACLSGKEARPAATMATISTHDTGRGRNNSTTKQNTRSFNCEGQIHRSRKRRRPRPLKSG